MKFVALVPIFGIVIYASTPPVVENRCGKAEDGKEILLGEMCDQHRQCSNNNRGLSVCRCAWWLRLTKVQMSADYLSDLTCKCDAIGDPPTQLVERGGVCECPEGLVMIGSPYGCVNQANVE